MQAPLCAQADYNSKGLLQSALAIFHREQRRLLPAPLSSHTLLSERGREAFASEAATMLSELQTSFQHLSISLIHHPVLFLALYTER